MLQSFRSRPKPAKIAHPRHRQSWNIPSFLSYLLKPPERADAFAKRRVKRQRHREQKFHRDGVGTPKLRLGGVFAIGNLSRGGVHDDDEGEREQEETFSGLFHHFRFVAFYAMVVRSLAFCACVRKVSLSVFEEGVLTRTETLK